MLQQSIYHTEKEITAGWAKIPGSEKKTGSRQVKQQEEKSGMIARMCLHDGICIFYIAQQFTI